MSTERAGVQTTVHMAPGNLGLTLRDLSLCLNSASDVAGKLMDSSRTSVPSIHGVTFNILGSCLKAIIYE